MSSFEIDLRGDNFIVMRIPVLLGVFAKRLTLKLQLKKIMTQLLIDSVLKLLNFCHATCVILLIPKYI